MRGPLLQLLHSLILHRRRVPLSCPLHFLANFFFPKSNTLSSAALHGIPSSRPTASHTLSRCFKYAFSNFLSISLSHPTAVFINLLYRSMHVVGAISRKSEICFQVFPLPFKRSNSSSSCCVHLRGPE